MFKKQGNKNPDPVNDLVHAHSGPVLVQMMDPEKEAGLTLVQMAQVEEI